MAEVVDRRGEERPEKPVRRPAPQANATAWSEEQIDFGGFYDEAAVAFANVLKGQKRLVLLIAADLAWIEYHRKSEPCTSDAELNERLAFFASNKVPRAARKRFFRRAMIHLNATAAYAMHSGIFAYKKKEADEPAAEQSRIIVAR